MIRTADHPIRQGMRLLAGGVIVRNGLMRHSVVVLGFYDQYVAFESGTGLQRPVFTWSQSRAAVDCKRLPIEASLRERPILVLVEGWRAQCQPSHRSQRRRNRCEIGTIAAAHHPDRGSVDRWLAGQCVICSHQVTQIVLPCDCLVLSITLLHASWLERQA